MRFLKFIIYGNLLVSLSAGSLAFASATRLGNPHRFGIGLIAFCATLFTYNIQRILRLREIKMQSTDRHRWLLENVLLIKVLAAIGLLGSILIYFLVLGWAIDFWLLAISATIGILYALKVFSKFDGLRDIPYIKIYLIALQWTLVAVYWPYLRLEEGIMDFPWSLFSSVFFFILAATVPFDIRDIVYDDQKKRTIPQIFGVKGAKGIALLFMTISSVSLVIFSPNVLHFWLFYVCYFVLGLLIINSQIRRREMYFSGLIDGWIIAFSILIVFL